jgi:type II secretory pathway pseudopilin PulG
MTKPTGRGGMTLIEILLALIVMVLGVLGILALFPPAMESAKESMEETNAAIVGESVAQGLTNAMRLSIYDTAKSQIVATLTHDLQAGTVKMKYRFSLPKIQSASDPVWMHFPSTTSPPDPDNGATLAANYDPEGDNRLFLLAGDGWVKETTDNVKKINDPTDCYNQFAFSFDIRKVYTMEYLIKPTPQPNPEKPGSNYTEKDLDPLMKLYEFRIYIFRTAQQMGAMGGGGTTTAGPGTDLRHLVGIVSKRIAAQ